MQIPLYYMRESDSLGIREMYNTKQELSNIEGLAEPYLVVPVIEPSPPPAAQRDEESTDSTAILDGPNLDFLSELDQQMRSGTYNDNRPYVWPYTNFLTYKTGPQQSKNLLFIPLKKSSTTGLTTITPKRAGSVNFEELKTIVKFEGELEDPQRLSELLQLKNQSNKATPDLSRASLVFEVYGACRSSATCISGEPVDFKSIHSSEGDKNTYSLPLKSFYKDSYESPLWPRLNVVPANIVGVNINLASLTAGPQIVRAEITVLGLDKFNIVPTALESNVTLTTPSNRLRLSRGSAPPADQSVEGETISSIWRDVNRPSTNLKRVNSLQPIGHDYSNTINDPLLLEQLLAHQLLLGFIIFSALFVLEVSFRTPLHAVQYYVIGATVCMLYILVIFLTDNLGFSLGYLTSSITIISLNGYYGAAIFHKLRRGLILAATQAAILGFIYLLLTQGNDSLMYYSVILTPALALLMFMVRDVNWHEVDRLAEQANFEDLK